MRGLQEPVACYEMHSWTFSGLIGAFVDLAIAYFLLCASVVAFFASKFLGLFGLSLPCPCDGVFLYPNRNFCLQSLLIDSPVERVSSVQLSIKNKFPFGSTWERDRNYQLNVKLVRDRDSCVHGLVEMESEASCSSTSATTRKSHNIDAKDVVLRNESSMGLGVLNPSLDLKKGNCDFKGKGNINQRPRIVLRRRRKVMDYGEVSSVTEYNSSCSDGRSPYGINLKGVEAFECSSEPVDSGVGLNLVQNGENQVIKNIEKSSSPGLELESVDENDLAAKNTSSFEEIKSCDQIELHFSGNETNEIKILEQALEQEHATRSALYFELEKERSAAATAADEAMAMILRLQEEKASVEMEARQFQRMMEEKSTYDAEEMNILKEIIVKRETEKHFLEKEVEAYRAMVYDGDMSGELAYALDLGDDTDLMLQQLSESIDNHGIIKDKISLNEVASTSEKKCIFSVTENGQRDLLIPSTSDEHGFSDKTIIVSGEQQEENDCFECVPTKSSETHDVIDVTFDMETHVHDVHVIDNKSDFLKGTQGEKSEQKINNDNSNVIGTSREKTEPIRRRSNGSDLIVGLPPLRDSVEGKSRVSDQRRNTMPSVDNERVKIDSEVEWLRERLRIVQEGRDKLNFSMERQERELFQVQILEDISCQLREIRQLTSPGKATRQASLPLLPPKVMSKKRRHRSVSVGVHKN